MQILFDTLFYDAFSVTKLYRVDDRMTSDDDNYEQTRTYINALIGILTSDHSIQAIKAYASDRTATGTG
jgi:hypothetical protein